MQPGAEIVGLGQTDAGQLRPVGGGSTASSSGHVLAGDAQRLGRGGQQPVMAAAGDHGAAEIDQHRFHAAPVQPHADAVGALRRQPVQGGRLAAAAVVALAERDDQPVLFELCDDAADRGVGQVGQPGQLGLRRLAGAAQGLQHQPLIVAAELHRNSCRGGWRTVALPSSPPGQVY